jgi:hypothetical protein
MSLTARRSSARKTTRSVTKKLETREHVKTGRAKTAKKLGLRLVYCAPESFRVTGLARGKNVLLDWDEHEQVWKATANGVVHRLPTFFLSPRTAKSDPKRFAAEAMAVLTRVMRAKPRAVHVQKGPLALGVFSP